MKLSVMSDSLSFSMKHHLFLKKLLNMEGFSQKKISSFREKVLCGMIRQKTIRVGWFELSRLLGCWWCGGRRNLARDSE